MGEGKAGPEGWEAHRFSGPADGASNVREGPRAFLWGKQERHAAYSRGGGRIRQELRLSSAIFSLIAEPSWRAYAAACDIRCGAAGDLPA